MLVISIQVTPPPGKQVFITTDYRYLICRYLNMFRFAGCALSVINENHSFSWKLNSSLSRRVITTLLRSADWLIDGAMYFIYRSLILERVAGIIDRLQPRSDSNRIDITVDIIAITDWWSYLRGKIASDKLRFIFVERVICEILLFNYIKLIL